MLRTKMRKASACALFEYGNDARIGKSVIVHPIPIPIAIGIWVHMKAALLLSTFKAASTPHPATVKSHPT